MAGLQLVRVTGADGTEYQVCACERCQAQSAVQYHEQRGQTIVRVYDQGRLALRVLADDGMFAIPTRGLTLDEVFRFPEARPLMTGGPVVLEGKTHYWAQSNQPLSD